MRIREPIFMGMDNTPLFADLGTQQRLSSTQQYPELF